VIVQLGLTQPISLDNNYVAKGRTGAARGDMTSEWEKLYQSAILESDWSKIEERIQVTDSAISARLQELSTSHGGTPEEKQRIEDALSGLRALRREVATWKSKAAG
jgi:hypothetical protein